MQNQKVIERLGYTSKEAKVYLASLKLGESHISDIAAAVKMPRSSVQVIVDRLHKVGLMNFYVMRRYKCWVAEKPEQLLANFKKVEVVIKEALPGLIALRQSSQKYQPYDESYKKSLSLLGVLADSSLQSVLITNSEGQIGYVNKAWQDTYGYKLDEVLGENPRNFNSPETPQEVYSQMWSALRSGKMFQSSKITDVRKDGTLFNLLTTIFPIKHGNRIFYIQILDDVTNEKALAGLKENFIKISD